MTELSKKKCIPCETKTQPLKEDAIIEYAEQLGGSWHVINEHHIENEYGFKNFKEALDFTNKVGEIAESEGHHPDIHLSWGKVRLVIWTHAINGLSKNDFILAAKCDQILAAVPEQP